MTVIDYKKKVVGDDQKHLTESAYVSTDSNKTIKKIEEFLLRSFGSKESSNVTLLSFMDMDLNHDGKVDEKDYKLLKDYLDGKHELDNKVLKNADLTSDEIVDYSDLRTFYGYLEKRHELEQRVRDLQQLYLSLLGGEIPGHVVSGVDNSDIAAVKVELGIARQQLYVFQQVSG